MQNYPWKPGISEKGIPGDALLVAKVFSQKGVMREEIFKWQKVRIKK